MKKFTQLLNEVKTAPEQLNGATALRESYVNGDIFQIGALVKTNKGIAEIINRGPNYVTLVKEGAIFKRWITDISETDSQSTKQSKIYKESFVVNGYKTVNFSKQLAEKFNEVAKVHPDKFALFTCAVCCDKLLGASAEELVENFDKFRIEFDRASKYLSKFDIVVEEMGAIEDKLLEYALFEGVKFSATNKHKVATIISGAVGHKSTSRDPTDIIHGSIDHVKKNRYSEEQWKILGKMLNKATEAGIKWDKARLHAITQQFMGLK
jgi:hypothetical protein